MDSSRLRRFGSSHPQLANALLLEEPLGLLTIPLPRPGARHRFQMMTDHLLQERLVPQVPMEDRLVGRQQWPIGDLLDHAFYTYKQHAYQKQMRLQKTFS